MSHIKNKKALAEPNWQNTQSYRNHTKMNFMLSPPQTVPDIVIQEHAIGLIHMPFHLCDKDLQEIMIKY